MFVLYPNEGRDVLSPKPTHRNAEVTAMKNRNELLALMFIAFLSLSVSGCYTQIASKTTEGGAAIRSERTMPSTDERGVNTENAENEDDENVVYVDDDYASEEDVPQEFGLKTRRYNDDWYSETEYDDGKTVINNFYSDGYYRDNPGYWYRTRPGLWHDSYWWGNRPGVYVGFGIGYDPYWRFGWYGGSGWGYDGYWMDPYPGWWDDPWYYNAWWPHRYGGWYAYGWDDYHHGSYGGYHPGGGGHDNGGDNPDSGRKYRQDRYAGFGTSRNAGGVVTVGNGSSNSDNTTEKASTSRTNRRDGRSGFGTTATRRETGTQSGTTEKKSGTTTTRRSGTNSRYENQDGTTVRQRTGSGLIIRRSRTTSDESAETSADKISRPVQENGDRQYRMNDRTDTDRTETRVESPDASGNTDTEARRTVRTRSGPWTIIRRSSQRTSAETESSSSNASNSETKSENSSVERTTTRSNSGSQASKSTPSSESRSSSASSSSRSSGSSSGSRSSSASSGSSGGGGGSRSSGGGGGSRSSGGSSGGSSRRR